MLLRCRRDDAAARAVPGALSSRTEVCTGALNMAFDYRYQSGLPVDCMHQYHLLLVARAHADTAKICRAQITFSESLGASAVIFFLGYGRFNDAKLACRWVSQQATDVIQLPRVDIKILPLSFRHQSARTHRFRKPLTTSTRPISFSEDTLQYMAGIMDEVSGVCLSADHIFGISRFRPHSAFQHFGRHVVHCCFTYFADQAEGKRDNAGT